MGDFPKTIGYWLNDRVYIVSGSQILSFTTDPDRCHQPWPCL